MFQYVLLQVMRKDFIDWLKIIGELSTISSTNDRIWPKKKNDISIILLFEDIAIIMANLRYPAKN